MTYSMLVSEACEKDIEKLSKKNPLLKEILNLSSIGDLTPIHDFGYWNEGPEPYKNIEWYLKNSYNPLRKQYDAGKILFEHFRDEPLQSERPHYDILILSDVSLCCGSGYSFVIGIGDPQIKRGSVISLKRYFDKGREVIKQAALHEFGHAFLGFGQHCGEGGDSKHVCIMKFPNDIPLDLEEQAKYRTETGRLLCDWHNSLPKGKPYLDTHPNHTKLFPEVQNLHKYVLDNRKLDVVKDIIDSGKLALLETRVELI